jgi:hypothetical protein
MADPLTLIIIGAVLLVVGFIIYKTISERIINTVGMALAIIGLIVLAIGLIFLIVGAV